MARKASGEWAGKDPDAKKDYSVDWTNMLQEGETIVSSTWSASPEGLTLYDGSVSEGRATTWISGGSAGTTYEVTNHIITSRGMEDDYTEPLDVAEE